MSAKIDRLIPSSLGEEFAAVGELPAAQRPSDDGRSNARYLDQSRFATASAKLRAVGSVASFVRNVTCLSSISASLQ
jgi:hypothetical protein